MRRRNLLASNVLPDLRRLERRTLRDICLLSIRRGGLTPDEANEILEGMWTIRVRPDGIPEVVDDEVDNDRRGTSTEVGDDGAQPANGAASAPPAAKRRRTEHTAGQNDPGDASRRRSGRSRKTPLENSNPTPSGAEGLQSIQERKRSRASAIVERHGVFIPAMGGCAPEADPPNGAMMHTEDDEAVRRRVMQEVRQNYEAALAEDRRREAEGSHAASVAATGEEDDEEEDDEEDYKERQARLRRNWQRERAEKRGKAEDAAEAPRVTTSDETQWICGACTFENGMDVQTCEMCGEGRSTMAWQCDFCGRWNPSNSDSCEKCHVHKKLGVD